MRRPYHRKLRLVAGGGVMSGSIGLEEVEGKKVVLAFTDRAVRRCGDWIERVILFGSRAGGASRPSSDYDLLVVVRERDRRLLDELYDEVLESLLVSGAEISLKVYGHEDLKKGLSAGHPFLRSVIETGVELWSAPRRS